LSLMYILSCYLSVKYESVTGNESLQADAIKSPRKPPAEEQPE
jgi:hypothetical protein